MNIKEIENFVTATLTVVAEDVDGTFPISSDEINGIVFGEIETDGDGNPIDDELAFTDDEEEASEIFNKISSKINLDCLNVYEETDYPDDEKNDMYVDVDLLELTIESIKKNMKKEKKKAKEEPQKKETQKKEKSVVTISLEDIADFNNDLKDKVDKSYIIIDEDILKNPEKDVKEYFDYLFENLLTEDIEHLSTKSQELLSQIDGFEVKIYEVKKEDKKEKQHEDEEPKEKKKRGRKATPKEDVVVNNDDKKEEKVKDEEAPENDDEKEEDSNHVCCGGCDSGVLGGVVDEPVLSQPISIELQAIKPTIDKSFVVFLEDIISAIKKYQGE